MSKKRRSVIWNRTTDPLLCRSHLLWDWWCWMTKRSAGCLWKVTPLCPPPPPPPQQQILPLLSLSESVSCSSTFAESKQYQIVWLFKLDVEWDDVLTPLNETTPHFYSISCWRASCHPLWESALKAGVLSDTLSTCCLNQRYGNM